jgi:precorrin-2 dehydrogenase / sirohydrochlorin ferrochelatase
MPRFPVFIDLAGKDVLVIGGGQIALRKVEGLLPFGPTVTLVAPECCPEVEALAAEGRLRLVRRRFEMGDLAGKRMVIVAADDLELQARVFAACEPAGVLCNAVDVEAYCNFLFPALVRRGELVVGITTSGKAPSVSAEIRRQLDGSLPREWEQGVEEVARLRAELPKGPTRTAELVARTRALFGPEARR